MSVKDGTELLSLARVLNKTARPLITSFEGDSPPRQGRGQAKPTY